MIKPSYTLQLPLYVWDETVQQTHNRLSDIPRDEGLLYLMSHLPFLMKDSTVAHKGHAAFLCFLYFYNRFETFTLR